MDDGRGGEQSTKAVLDSVFILEVVVVLKRTVVVEPWLGKS